MEAFQKFTVDVDQTIHQNGQEIVEAKRFKEVMDRLGEYFHHTQRALRSDSNSHVGIEELPSIAN